MRLAFALCLLASSAAAETKKPPDKFAKAAGEAFTAAAAADSAGDLRTALGLYQKAHAISPHASTAYNIADVQRRLGQLRTAIKGYETYLAMAPDAKDRPQVEKILDELAKTPGKLIIITVDASNPEAIDLASAYVIVGGKLEKKPGPVEQHPMRKVPAITLMVPPGEHVVDLVTSLTYATRECDVDPGEQTWCELRAAPRIDGNVVVSATNRRIDVKQEGQNKDLVYKRFELPPGKHRLTVKDRNYGCGPLAIDVPGANFVAYSFVAVGGFDGVKRCRTLDIKHHKLQFDP